MTKMHLHLDVIERLLRDKVNRLCTYLSGWISIGERDKSISREQDAGFLYGRILLLPSTYMDFAVCTLIIKSSNFLVSGLAAL